ncbi:MAG TPA: CE1759 family FMN reductase [Mycobacteriales bacterium]
MTRVAVVTAGVSTPSSTRLLADRLAAAVADALPGADIQIIELRPLARDLADAVVTGFPAGALASAVATVGAADAVIAVTPVFAASYSGLFKMFVDVLEPDALRGTPVLLAATAGSARHSLVLEHAMRPLFSYLRALTVPTAVFAAPEDWAGATPLADRIDRAATELAELVAGRPAHHHAATPVPFEQLLAG